MVGFNARRRKVIEQYSIENGLLGYGAGKRVPRTTDHQQRNS